MLDRVFKNLMLTIHLSHLLLLAKAFKPLFFLCAARFGAGDLQESHVLLEENMVRKRQGEELLTRTESGLQEWTRPLLETPTTDDASIDVLIQKLDKIDGQDWLSWLATTKDHLLTLAKSPDDEVRFLT